MSPSPPHRRPQIVRVARLAVLAACLAVSSAVRGADDPPRQDPKPAGRIFVRALYAGDHPDGKPQGIVALDPDTAQADVTYPILTPGKPSPDGRFFVYSKGGGNLPKDEAGIWAYDGGGEGTARRIFDRMGEPSWTDDGRSVVIAVNVKDDQWETWRVARDGAGPIKLPIPDSMLVLDASPDGTWLAARAVGGDPEHWGRLSLIHPDGTGIRHLTEGSAKQDVFSIFRFSPDGREIADVEVKTVDGVRTSRLFLVDLDGKNRRELPVGFDRGGTVSPVWSPDGSRLALALIAPQTSAIAVVDRDGKNFRRLPLPPWPWFFTLCGWSR
jgi:WD40-like Beta Propeller Repeat